MKNGARKALLAGITAGLMVVAGQASAHVWNIGWKSVSGGLTFYGTSWHTGGISSGSGDVDDFASRPAGFVLNGTNITFDVGSSTDLNDCYGPGGLTTGSCSPSWNALNLDGAISSSSYLQQYYGKYALATLDSTELAALGIGTGSNSVTLGTFSDNVHWATTPFASATVPIDIIVNPDPDGPTPVPLPAGLPLVASALGLLGLLGSRRGKAAG